MTCLIVIGCDASNIVTAAESMLATQSRLNLVSGSISVKNSISAIEYALFLYRLDCLDRVKKDIILTECAKNPISSIDVVFDLENMGIKRKGWTRYYPVMIGEKLYVVRIFLTREKVYQEKITPEIEVDLKDPQVTCQIISGVSGILKDTPITSQSGQYKQFSEKSL